MLSITSSGLASSICSYLIWIEYELYRALCVEMLFLLWEATGITWFRPILLQWTKELKLHPKNAYFRVFSHRFVYVLCHFPTHFFFIFKTGKYAAKKSRRTDVEDLTPNPRKLLQIGNELRKLNKVISDLTPVSELPLTARPRSRKEKNKLASRYALGKAAGMKKFGLLQVSDKEVNNFCLKKFCFV